MLCAICEAHPRFEYKICNPCREVLIRIPTENCSRFIEEMMASPAAGRERIRLRWRDESRREFYPDRKGPEQGRE